MCRLLGVVSTAPIAVSEAVGADVLKDFVALTKIHGDGWGIAHLGHAGDDPRVEVSAGSALDDPLFTAATQERRSAASLVHLRWATNGLAVEPQNSHPFVADGIAMAHNGSIKPIGPARRAYRASHRRVVARDHRQRALLRSDPPAPPNRAGSGRGGPPGGSTAAAALPRRQP